MPKTAHELETDIDPWEHLPEAEMSAIQMRYEGKSQQEIADALEVPVNTVAGWFRRTGKLLDPYIGYAAKQNELIRGEATNALKGLLKKSVKKLETLIDSKNEKVSLGAVQEVLDRELGKPTQPIVTEDSREVDQLAADVQNLLDQFDIQNGYQPFAANPNGDTEPADDEPASDPTADEPTGDSVAHADSE